MEPYQCIESYRIENINEWDKIRLKTPLFMQNLELKQMANKYLQMSRSARLNFILKRWIKNPYKTTKLSWLLAELVYFEWEWGQEWSGGVGV